jgi:hypothetical protein
MFFFPENNQNIVPEFFLFLKYFLAFWQYFAPKKITAPGFWVFFQKIMLLFINFDINNFWISHFL